jgi:hypothetical protein
MAAIKAWAAALLLLAGLICQPSRAQTAVEAQAAAPAEAVTTEADAPSMVVINGTRSPELQPYRYMLSGLDAFDDYHALAPAATEVRFRLRGKSKAPADVLDGAVVRLSGKQTDVTLPLAKDGRFILPRDDAAQDDNADVVVNRKKSYIGWSPDIRSAGVPDGMRRLGDIRLECRVMVAVAKNYIPFLLRAMINTLTLTTDWCGFKDFNLNVHGDRQLTSATLVDGERRVPLRLDDDGTSYFVPIGNKSYSNDALIELQ